MVKARCRISAHLAEHQLTYAAHDCPSPERAATYLRQARHLRPGQVLDVNGVEYEVA